jgi:type II secretory pathway pseudopilin PulG
MTRIRGRRISEQRPRQQEGYILLMLLLVIALLVIAAAAIAPTIAFQIRRDREEEMVHRGVQYTRAFRAFSKKTGRYPRRFEELRETNGVRFLRKVYKDPITGQDFKPLHMMDIPVLGQSPNVNPSGSQIGASETGSNSDPSNPDQTDSAAAAPSPGSSNASSAGSLITGPTSSGSASAGSTSAGLTWSNQQPGLLICGVVSTSKAKSIREFDHKNHYKDWLFFYDPRYDTGREIKGPTSLTPAAATLLTPPAGQSQNPGSQNFGSQNPGMQNFGSQAPGTQAPGTSSPPSLAPQ